MVREKIQIRFSDFDSFQHVNNAVYSSYFEIGRVAWMDQVLGVGPGSTLKDIPFILARVEIDMLNPIDYAMEAEVLTLVSRLGNSSWDFQAFLIEPSTDDVYAQAKTVQVCYDYSSGSTIKVEGNLRATLERLLNEDRPFIERYIK